MTVDQYIAALKTADWFYEYSDDYDTWRCGLDAIHQLRAAQRQLDPLGVIWNQHAPRDLRISPN